jgi:FtsH-binding integral membrane protein
VNNKYNILLWFFSLFSLNVLIVGIKSKLTLSIILSAIGLCIFIGLIIYDKIKGEK